MRRSCLHSLRLSRLVNAVKQVEHMKLVTAPLFLFLACCVYGALPDGAWTLTTSRNTTWQKFGHGITSMC